MKKVFNRTFAGLGTALIAVLLAAYIASDSHDIEEATDQAPIIKVDQTTNGPTSTTISGDGNTVIGDGNKAVNTGTIVLQSD